MEYLYELFLQFVSILRSFLKKREQACINRCINVHNIFRQDITLIQVGRCSLRRFDAAPLNFRVRFRSRCSTPRTRLQALPRPTSHALSISDILAQLMSTGSAIGARRVSVSGVIGAKLAIGESTLPHACRMSFNGALSVEPQDFSIRGRPPLCRPLMAASPSRRDATQRTR